MRAMAQKHGHSHKHGTSAKRAHHAGARGAAVQSAAVHSVVVYQGDTLSSIARTHDIKGGWRALYHRNRAAIGPDPSHLRIGMRLTY